MAHEPTISRGTPSRLNVITARASQAALAAYCPRADVPAGRPELGDDLLHDGVVAVTFVGLHH